MLIGSLDLEDQGNTIIPNIDIYSSCDAASNSRTQEFSTTLLQKLRTLQPLFPYTQIDYLCPGHVFYEAKIKLLNIIFLYICNKMQFYTVYLYLETALRVLGGTIAHHQEHKQLYL
jgi:hypothetical protein